MTRLALSTVRATGSTDISRRDVGAIAKVRTSLAGEPFSTWATFVQGRSTSCKAHRPASHRQRAIALDMVATDSIRLGIGGNARRANYQARQRGTKRPGTRNPTRFGSSQGCIKTPLRRAAAPFFFRDTSFSVCPETLALQRKENPMPLANGPTDVRPGMTLCTVLIYLYCESVHGSTWTFPLGALVNVPTYQVARLVQEHVLSVYVP